MLLTVRRRLLVVIIIAGICGQHSGYVGRRNVRNWTKITSIQWIMNVRHAFKALSTKALFDWKSLWGILFSIGSYLHTDILTSLWRLICFFAFDKLDEFVLRPFFPVPPVGLDAALFLPWSPLFFRTFFVLGSLLSFFHFIRRFWNHILICRSDSTSVWAISILRRRVR